MPLIGIFILNLLELSINLERSDSKEDGRDCGGVSTRGHGQREGPDGDKWS